jgi:hypothetical protein
MVCVGGRHRCAALAQGQIAVAHGVEERGAFLRRFLQRQGKQNFFAVWAHSKLIMRVAPISLLVRFGQGNAFGLEQRFRFALP